MQCVRPVVPPPPDPSRTRVRFRPLVSFKRVAGVSLLLGFLILSSAPPNHAADSESREKRALPALVQDFLAADGEEQASRILTEILRDPRADLATVETMIKAGRSYGSEPVGVQPEVPVQVKGRTYQYALYVPLSYQPIRDYALVICLHGAGFTGETYLERWQTRLGEQYILVCPTYGRGDWWTRQAEELVLATIQSVQARYRIDPHRIFLTGMSNGGIGAYLIGVHHAPLFAGLAPMASGLDDVLMPFLENLRSTPIYMIHGAKDQVMPVELSRAIARELTRLGYPFVYREHERIHPMAGGHFFPREELPALVDWFGSRRRDPFPRHVTVVRDATHLAPFGWVRIDTTDRIAAFSEDLTDSRDEAIVNRRYARLEAEVVAPNRIEVRTRLVRSYSLYLNQALVDLAKPVTVVTDGRISYEGTVTPSVETLLRDARMRQDRKRLFPVMLSVTVEGLL
jgi:dienelactone hydrolase